MYEGPIQHQVYGSGASAVLAWLLQTHYNATAYHLSLLVGRAKPSCQRKYKAGELCAEQCRGGEGGKGVGPGRGQHWWHWHMLYPIPLPGHDLLTEINRDKVIKLAQVQVNLFHRLGLSLRQGTNIPLLHGNFLLAKVPCTGHTEATALAEEIFCWLMQLTLPFSV